MRLAAVVGAPDGHSVSVNRLTGTTCGALARSEANTSRCFGAPSATDAAPASADVTASIGPRARYRTGPVCIQRTSSGCVGARAHDGHTERIPTAEPRRQRDGTVLDRTA